MNEVQTLSEHAKEIVITGIDITDYKIDGKRALLTLLKNLESKTYRVRLGSIENTLIDKDFIKGLKGITNLCPHFHLSLQSGCDATLKRMNRRYSSGEYYEKVLLLRKAYGNPAITTDVIVGFPGETEEEFEELVDFVKEVRFDRLGAFCYSSEEGTPASKMKGKVKKAVKQDRYNRLMECQQSISREINESRVGEIYDVLVEGVSDDGIFYYGRSYAEGPDVDGRIYFTANDPLSAGDMVKVKILIAEEYDLTGCQI